MQCHAMQSSMVPSMHVLQAAYHMYCELRLKSFSCCSRFLLAVLPGGRVTELSWLHSRLHVFSVQVEWHTLLASQHQDFRNAACALIRGPHLRRPAGQQPWCVTRCCNDCFVLFEAVDQIEFGLERCFTCPPLRSQLAVRLLL